MKIKKWHFAFLALIISVNTYGQLKILPQNHTLLGPNWWSSWPTLSDVNLFINGKTEIAPTNAATTIYFDHYTNSTGDDPALIPQAN